jgi:hypothetical protein
MGNVSNKSCRGNQNTYFIFSKFFFKSFRLWEYLEIYFRAGQATDDNMVHCALHAGYLRLQIYTVKFRNIHFLCTSTMVNEHTSNFSLYIYCLSFFQLWWLYLSPVVRNAAWYNEKFDRTFFFICFNDTVLPVALCSTQPLTVISKVKVKQSRYKPGVAQRVPGI